MIRVIIVDDEEPARAKLRRWLGVEPDMEIAGEFADGLSAAHSIIDFDQARK
jgi:two-component system, LytTR family, response regulator